MEFNTLYADNTLSKRVTDAKISFARHAVHRISGAAVEIMGYDAGNMIGVHQDAANGNDWYISLLQERGFVLIQDKRSCALVWYNADLGNTVLDSFGFATEQDRVAFYIDSKPMEVDGVEYWKLHLSKPE